MSDESGVVTISTPCSKKKVTFADIESDTETEPEEDEQDHLEKVLRLDDMVAEEESEEDVFNKIFYQEEADLCTHSSSF